MKMIKKKLKSLIYAGLGLVLCVLLCGGIGMTSQAAESKTYNGFTYEKDKDGITITGYTGGKTAVVIPGKIKGTQVTKIGKNAFLYSNMTSVKMPEGLKTIEYQAFAGCSGLTSVIVPDSVTSIETGAFATCYNLRSITLSKNLKSMGEWVFYICDSLESIVIPRKVTKLEHALFQNCDSLYSVTLPDGLTSIGADAFSGCSLLNDITLPDSLTSIGGDAFGGCSNLTSLILPDSLTSIGGWAFSGCSRLTDITLPSGIKSIGSYAFSRTGITSITIPRGVTDIGERAFANCDKLKSITIPNSVKNMFVSSSMGETYTFLNGSPNATIICNKNSAAYKYAKEYKIPVRLIRKPAKKGTTFTVSSKKIKVKVTSSAMLNPTVTVSKITDKKATKLSIPDTVKVGGVTYKVTAIADKAFKGNKKLTTVTIGRNVKKIGKEAFAGCRNLKKIIVTAGRLKNIGKSAFKGIHKNASIIVIGVDQETTTLKKKLKKSYVGHVKTWKIE